MNPHVPRRSARPDHIPPRSARPGHPLSAHIASVLAIDPDAGAIDFGGSWTSWGQLGTLARSVADLVGRLNPEPTPRAGILLRNTPEHVAAFLGVLLAGGTVVVINPPRGDERTRDDIAALALPVVIGTGPDLNKLVAGSASTSVVRLDAIPAEPEVIAEATEKPSAKPTSEDAPSPVAVHMLTSGTTGPPKRVELGYDMLAHSVLGEPGKRIDTPTKLSSGAAIVNAPLVHIGGIYRILQCIVAARPFALLGRFDLDEWARAVRTHRPKAVSLVPTAVRMVLHSDLTRDDLASVKVVTSGTAPLSVEDSEAFTDKFGIPVLTSYAATEFGGGVAGWSLADHKRYWADKRGSVGRASGGAQLRVVDENGTVLRPGESGLLEVKPGQLGPDVDWIRTTDLGKLDADGFLWILGRADQAIIRGGFKVIPDVVRDAIESHPAVAGASVVGRPDERLGETPAAVVELRPGATATSEEILAHLGGRLARYEVPTELVIVDTIPRTPSGKADLRAVRDQLAGAAR